MQKKEITFKGVSDYILYRAMEEEQQYIKLFTALEAKGKFLSLVEQKRIEQRVKPRLK